MEAKEINLIGFDGFGNNDPRNNQVQESINIFSNLYPDVIVTALTKTYYNINKSSIYSYE